MTHYLSVLAEFAYECFFANKLVVTWSDVKSSCDSRLVHFYLNCIFSNFSCVLFNLNRFFFIQQSVAGFAEYDGIRSHGKSGY